MDNVSAWSYGGAILTFLVPMLAFAAVILALLVLGTRTELVVPGRRKGDTSPVVGTRLPGEPAEAGKADVGNTAAEPDKAASAG